MWDKERGDFSIDFVLLNMSIYITLDCLSVICWIHIEILEMDLRMLIFFNKFDIFESIMGYTICEGQRGVALIVHILCWHHLYMENSNTKITN